MKDVLTLPKVKSLAGLKRVTPQTLIRLNICLMLVILWHATHIPFWGTIGGILLCLWRLSHDTRGTPIPSKQVRFVLTVIAFAAIIISFNTFWGRDPGITALVLLAGIKFLELKSIRDFMLVAYMCFFLVMGNFLYYQATVSFFFMFVVIVLLLSTLIHLNAPNIPNRKRWFYVKAGGKYLVMALPVLALLFFFFPRGGGMFFRLSRQYSQEGVTGFRDRINPGEVSRLAQSNATAFRVIFPDDNMPPQEELYFRGLVLWFTDGTQWFQGSFRSRERDNVSEGLPRVNHDIILEPHLRRWLFGLDVPVEMPEWMRQYPGQIFQSRYPIRGHLRYRVSSILMNAGGLGDRELHPYVKRWSLQVPRNISDRIRNLAQGWRDQYDSDRDISEAGLDYFVNNDFLYTLNTGDLDPAAPLEDFLFSARKGFCEHFAASYALLMRIAGIPARVVVGYQGGQYNPVGDFLLIRQKDAHAWTEVWLEGTGWERVDPTGVIAPNRIQFATDDREGISAGRLEGDDLNRQVRRRGLFRGIFRTLKDFWQTVEINWSLWVISYDRYTQWYFFRNLGIWNLDSYLILFLIIIAVAVFVILLRWFLRRDNGHDNQLPSIYMNFCKRLEKKNIRRESWEGPLDFKLKLIGLLPSMMEEIRQALDLYIQLRYGKYPVTHRNLSHLKRLMRQVRI